ncbi:MAG: hypothetical protein ACRDX8_13015 [Acidimicrobiales bacterium]
MAATQAGYATMADGSPMMTSSGAPVGAPANTAPGNEHVARWLALIILASLAWLVFLSVVLRRFTLP